MDNLSDILRLDPNASPRSFRKGDLIQQKGEQIVRTYYVKSGLVRSYIIDQKGKEHIFSFAPEGWIIADVESLEFREPAELFISCLEDTEVVIFNRDCLFQAEVDKELIIQNFRLLYRRMGVLQRRIIMQMSAPASERYTYFLQTWPDLSHRIPQHMIASYLGITPQALSTIRSKMTKTK